MNIRSSGQGENSKPEQKEPDHRERPQKFQDKARTQNQGMFINDLQAFISPSRATIRVWPKLPFPSNLKFHEGTGLASKPSLIQYAISYIFNILLLYLLCMSYNYFYNMLYNIWYTNYIYIHTYICVFYLKILHVSDWNYFFPIGWLILSIAVALRQSSLEVDDRHR